MEDISFDSEIHNIFDPFFSSESDYTSSYGTESEEESSSSTDEEE